MHGVYVSDHVVWTRNDGVQVWSNLGRLLEVVNGDLCVRIVEVDEIADGVLFEQMSTFLAIRVIVLLFHRVGDCHPFVRAEHSELHLCPQTRLVKARKDFEGVVNFELGVKVLEIILGVGVGVETCPVLVVGGEVSEHHRVPALHQVSAIEDYPLSLEAFFFCLLFVIDHQLADCHCIRT